MSSVKPPSLLEDVRRVMRLKHYSLHTERSYCDWIKQFVKFHRMTERQALFDDSEAKIETFLSYLTTQRNVASATQNQAMNALVFLYKHVLNQPLTKRIDAIRSKTHRHVPVVLAVDEVKQILARLEGLPQLVVKLLYGSGLRISEAVRLRVLDIDFMVPMLCVGTLSGTLRRPEPTSGSACIPTLERGNDERQMRMRGV